jgi:uncharacterized membrane protein YhaH (DUF805 family)
MNWFQLALKKYAVFSGRSQRSEYWYFVLFYLLIYIGLSIVDGVIGAKVANGTVGLLSTLFSLAMLVPSLSVTVRRLHDTGRSGWWLLVAFVPLVGGIVLLVFMVQDSQAGANEHGPNPKDNAQHTPLAPAARTL